MPHRSALVQFPNNLRIVREVEEDVLKGGNYVGNIDKEYKRQAVCVLYVLRRVRATIVAVKKQ